ncbi:MAG: ExeM/NucH family extracellular endonuclease [Vibrio sp.]
MSLPTHADIIISQYVEGSSNNKAIELTNTGSEVVSLANYKLVKYTNGTLDSFSELALTDSLDPQQSFVVAHTSASDEIKALADITNTSVVSFNGNDPVQLIAADGQVVDSIGFFTGDNWGKDVTLVRKEEVISGFADYDESQWDVLAKDDITGLGNNEPIEPPVAFTCESPTLTEIYAIQGDADTSPLIDSGFESNDEYTTQGVVTAVVTGLESGFYLQSLAPDGDPQTSDGIYVFWPSITEANAPEVGDIVCAQGKLKEYFNLTELAVTQNNWVVTGSTSPIQAQDIEILPSDDSFAQTLERYEGMLVNLPKNLDMRITRTFSYDYDARRNNLVLAQGQVNHQPNEFAIAGSDQAIAAAKANADRRLFVESDQRAGDDELPYFAGLAQDADQDQTPDSYLRINDRVFDLQGVVSFSFDEYRLIATNTIDSSHVEHLSDRTSIPNVLPGDLTLASFNVLNYFNSPYGGDPNDENQNRGAESFDEFIVQETKIATAIAALNADIVGIMEIENNGFGENGAIATLVAAINALQMDTDDHYQYVGYDSNQDGMIDQDDRIGSDVIAVGVLYRPTKVSLDTSRLIQLPMQDVDGDQAFQRDSLAPTFIINPDISGEAERQLTVSVNHFKSKGSTCYEDDASVEFGGQNGEDPDLQGSCERFRVAGAIAVGEALEQIQGDKIILGDLNSYSLEDPMLVLTDYSFDTYPKQIFAARNTQFVGLDGQITPQFGEQGFEVTQGYGYINIVRQMRPNGWGYSFNDEVGELDHILISPSLVDAVLDAGSWNINSSEMPALSYVKRFKGDLPDYLDVYRSSDHDPAIVSLVFDHEAPTEPVDPIDPVEPTKPEVVEPTDPVEPTKPEVVEPTDPVEPTEPEVVEPTDPVEPTKPEVVEPTDPVEPTEPEVVEPTDPVEPTEPEVVEPTDPVEPTEPEVVEPTEPVNPTDPEQEESQSNSDSGGSLGYLSLLALIGLAWRRKSQLN